ncbi:hypothetical protein CsSME_00032234 [Camellia sinensis var. sinensis]
MMLGMNTKTGEKRFLSSWLTENDPSPGKFLCGCSTDTPPQVFIWNGSKPYWRWSMGRIEVYRDTGRG